MTSQVFLLCKKVLDIRSKFNGKYILIGDLNAEELEPFSPFLFEMNEKLSLKNLTALKIYVSFITNSSSNFQNVKTIPIDLTLFFRSSSLKELLYRFSQTFDGILYKKELVEN